jgi:hypothetical protein
MAVRCEGLGAEETAQDSGVKFYIVLGAIAALLLAVAGIALLEHHTGYDSGHDDAIADCAKRMGKLDPTGDDLCATAIKGVLAQAQSDRARFEQQQQAEQSAHATAIAAVAATYKQEIQYASKAADRTIAGLRAANQRLRDNWRCPATASTGVQKTAAGGSGADAAADGSQRIAFDLFRAIDPIVERQDAQIRALQQVVQEDRQ